MFKPLLTAVFLSLALCGFAQELRVSGRVKLLALGDSYTIGASVPATDRWPVQLIDSLRQRGVFCDEPRIIATSGWRTDNLKDAIGMANLKNDQYNLVGLLIGVNNYFQGRTVESYKPEFLELLTTAIALAGGNLEHVFVISIPDYGYTPFGQNGQPTISAGIDLFNAANLAITSDKNVPYFNITDISRMGISDPELVASDGLHPSGKQYTRWVERILKGITIDSTLVTGVGEKALPVTVFPNPFTSSISITGFSPVNTVAKFRLINLQGSVVLEEEVAVENAQAFINTRQIPRGLYVYQLVATGKAMLTGKVFKE